MVLDTYYGPMQCAPARVALLSGRFARGAGPARGGREEYAGYTKGENKKGKKNEQHSGFQRGHPP